MSRLRPVLRAPRKRRGRAARENGLASAPAMSGSALHSLLAVQRDLAVTLGATEDPGQALRCVLAAATRIEGIDCGGVYAVDPVSGAVDLIARTGLSDAFVRDVLHYGPHRRRAKIIARGRPHYRAWCQIRSSPVLTGEGLKATAAIPISCGATVVGALNLGSRSVDRISPPVRDTLEAMAAQVGGLFRRIRSGAAMRESRKNLRTLFDSMSDMMFVVDADGNIVDLNRPAVRALGYPGKELVGRNVLCMHPRRRRNEAAAVLADIQGGRTTVCTVPLQTRDGRTIPVETRVTHGHWDGRRVLFGVSRDIRDRLAVESALRQSREMLHGLLDATSDIVVLLRRDWTVEAINTAGLRSLGICEREAINRRIFDLMPAEMVASRKRRLRQVVRTRRPVRFTDQHDGRWLDNRVFPVLDAQGQVAAIAVFAEDVTEHRRMEQEILHVSDFERMRVGQDLHDTLLQELTGIGMLTGALKRRAAAAKSPLLADIRRIGGLVSGSVAQARRIARGLSPVAPQEGGLEYALTELAEQTTGMFGIRCRAVCNIAAAVANPELTTHVYSIAREAVGNAVRHGGSSRIEVRLTIARGGGLLRVTDNGRGLRAADRNNHGMGLSIMRYRAEALGGTLDIRRASAKGGTTVECRFTTAGASARKAR